MQLTNEILAVLWLGAGAVALWMVLPPLLNALGCTLWQSSIAMDAAAIEPDRDDPEYEELFAQLRDLGFAPYGKRTTRCWLFLHHWCKTFRSHVFAAREGDAIALAYKLRDWDPWRLCFVTAFSDGAIVETANQLASLRIDEPDHVRWGLATPDRALLLERHREVCREFAAQGSRGIAALPAEVVNEHIKHHTARWHRKRHQWTGLSVLAQSLTLLGAIILLVRYLVGSAPYLLPVSIIAWGLLWPAVHGYLFRVGAGMTRAEDARCRRNQPAH